MDPQFLNMTIVEAIRSDQRILKALETTQGFSMKVRQVMETYPSFKKEVQALPRHAMVTGMAEADNGHRIGVYGRSNTNIGVYGESKEDIGVFGQGGRLAAQFIGNVEVTGDIRLTGDVEVAGDIRLTGAADCAEDFDISGDEAVEPGTVMVLGQEGTLQPSTQAYDKRVAGVISGAGDYKPGIVLDKQQSEGNRSPVALLGKVFCKVDADYAPIDVGDLLTTSATPGYAMNAVDPLRAFGAVIGKALRSLREGRGLIPILIALQ